MIKLLSKEELLSGADEMAIEREIDGKKYYLHMEDFFQLYKMASDTLQRRALKSIDNEELLRKKGLYNEKGFKEEIEYQLKVLKRNIKAKIYESISDPINNGFGLVAKMITNDQFLLKYSNEGIEEEDIVQLPDFEEWANGYKEYALIKFFENLLKFEKPNSQTINDFIKAEGDELKSDIVAIIREFGDNKRPKVWANIIVALQKLNRFKIIESGNLKGFWEGVILPEFNVINGSYSAFHDQFGIVDSISKGIEHTDKRKEEYLYYYDSIQDRLDQIT